MEVPNLYIWVYLCLSVMDKWCHVTREEEAEHTE